MAVIETDDEKHENPYKKVYDIDRNVKFDKIFTIICFTLFILTWYTTKQLMESVEKAQGRLACPFVEECEECEESKDSGLNKKSSCVGKTVERIEIENKEYYICIP